MRSLRSLCCRRRVVLLATFWSILIFIVIYLLIPSRTSKWMLSTSELSNTLDLPNSDEIDLVGHIWPRPYNETFDRQLNQLVYMDKYEERTRGQNRTMKVIFLVGGFDWHSQSEGQIEFIKDKCPINECIFTRNSNLKTTADALFITNWDPQSAGMYLPKPKHQIWITHHVESPKHNRIDCESLKDNVNWTVSFRRDSTIFFNSAVFEPISTSKSTIDPIAAPINYASNKTQLVATLVSNCNPSNNRRTYTAELEKHISVHVYGNCGNHQCPSNLAKITPDGGLCGEWVADRYKFYLSFENSNCKDYITEKLMMNGLRQNIVPIVLGAFPEDYAARAPPHSYINVDDFSGPEELAAYLHKLDKNDTLYNEYFAWKGHWSYRIYPQEKHLCRLCMLLHLQEDVGYVHWYENYDKWWNVCRDESAKRRYELPTNATIIKR